MLFEAELKKLGLKDKEAAVYLSCLQLGPSPVQPIARKAKVVRATTYVVLESLMHRGLVTKFKEGKKTLFSAEPPRQLMRLLEKEREFIAEKQSELEGLLPELQALMHSGGDRPSVRYFAGREGLIAMRQEIVMYSEPGQEVNNFTPVDHVDAVFQKNEETYVRQRLAKKIKSRTIFTTKSPIIKDTTLKLNNNLAQFRYIPPEVFSFDSGLTIFRDRIALGSFSGKLGGVIIESAPITNMARHLFELAWRGAEKYQIEPVSVS